MCPVPSLFIITKIGKGHPPSPGETKDGLRGLGLKLNSHRSPTVVPSAGDLKIYSQFGKSRKVSWQFHEVLLSTLRFNTLCNTGVYKSIIVISVQ